MMRGLSCIALGTALSLLTLIGPLQGGELRDGKSAWEEIDLKAQEKVKWVYEGCAAYPVAETPMSMAEHGLKPKADGPDETARPAEVSAHMDRERTR